MTPPRTIRSMKIFDFFYQIGKCSFCMRTAFKAMAGAWCIILSTCFLYQIYDVRELFLLSSVSATFFTLLWGAHLTTFAYKSAKHKLSLQNSVEVSLPRRQTIFLFLNSLSFAVLMTSFPRQAFAQQRSDCNDSSNWCDASAGLMCCGSGNETWCCSYHGHTCGSQYMTCD